MKFTFKIFIATFSVAAVVLTLSAGLILKYLTTRTEADYIHRYQSIATEIGDSLAQIDKTTDMIMTNALYALREREKRGLPSNAELLDLRRHLGIETLYITDNQGRFTRSDWFIVVANSPKLRALYGGNPLSKSLFSYCKDYHDLITGRSSIEKTPIIPSGNEGWPYKFLMIPNHNRTGILEADMPVKSIGDILKNVMRPDSGVESIGLFTPRGEVLGFVNSSKIDLSHVPAVNTQSISFAHPEISKSHLVFFTKVRTSAEQCCECKARGLTQGDGVYYYLLRTEVSRDALTRQLAEIRSWCLRLMIIALLLSAIAAFLVSRHVVQKLSWMGDQVKKIADSKDLSLRLRMSGRDEVAALASQFDGMMEQMETSQQRLAAAEREKAFVALATQVAHDIRSPLAALDSIAGNVERLPEDRRAVVRDALGRIHDIADNLLEKYRVGSNGNGKSAPSEGSNGRLEDSLQMLPELITPVIAEKRFTYQTRPEVTINATSDTTGEGLVVRVEPAEFKRVLSNLIDNGVEALPGRGEVTVSVARDGDSIEVQVKDTGKGIPVEYRDEVGRRGRSFGKMGGSGLGLYHAKTCVERWGGRLEIDSEIGGGTMVTLRLPVASPPSSQPDAVLIDDDLLVRANWKVAARNNGKALETFSTPREFMAIVGRIDKNTPIYVDSMLADGVRGEEFAKELHAQGFRNLYLATGQHRDMLPPMPWIREVVGKTAPWG